MRDSGYSFARRPSPSTAPSVCLLIRLRLSLFRWPRRERCSENDGDRSPVLLYSQGHTRSAIPCASLGRLASASPRSALGTLFGGWRIVHTMGSKITRLNPMQGFCAETGGALTLFARDMAWHPGLDDPYDHGCDHRRRRRTARLRGAVGIGGQHRHCMGDNPAGCCRHLRASLLDHELDGIETPWRISIRDGIPPVIATMRAILNTLRLDGHRTDDPHIGVAVRSLSNRLAAATLRKLLGLGILLSPQGKRARPNPEKV